MGTKIWKKNGYGAGTVKARMGMGTGRVHNTRTRTYPIPIPDFFFKKNRQIAIYIGWTHWSSLLDFKKKGSNF